MSDASLQPILALIGHPVAGNPAQYLFEKSFAHHELDWRFLSFDVLPDDLETAVRGMQKLGIDGGIIAEPFGCDALQYFDTIDDRAKQIGAIDCWTRQQDLCIGLNLSGRAVIDLLEASAPVRDAQAVILGSGIAARATAVELAVAGAARITLVTGEHLAGQAVDLINSLKQFYPQVHWSRLLQGQTPLMQFESQGETDQMQALEAEDESPLESHDALVIAGNAASGDRFIVPPETTCLINTIAHDVDEIDSDCGVLQQLDISQLGTLHETPVVQVVDVTLNPASMSLLHDAAEHGCQTITGLDILLRRARLQFQTWIGFEPDISIMRDVAEEYLDI